LGLERTLPVVAKDDSDQAAKEVAKELLKRIDNETKKPVPSWIEFDGLPLGHLFVYEKDIVNAYIDGKGTVSGDLIGKGCPPSWPKIERRETGANYDYGKDEKFATELAAKIGNFRTSEDRIVVDARLKIVEKVVGQTPDKTFFDFPRSRSAPARSLSKSRSIASRHSGLRRDRPRNQLRYCGDLRAALILQGLPPEAVWRYLQPDFLRVSGRTRQFAEPGEQLSNFSR